MGPLCTDVVRACRALVPRVGFGTADALEAVAARAAATPALVVTGPVSSGKSTLVNALVGRRVAPTGAGECTRLVAHYVRGPVDRLDVVLVDGSRRPLPLVDGGRVPAAVGDRLGVDPADVDHLLVTLTSDPLEGLTVVDTPGTGSARRPARRGTAGSRVSGTAGGVEDGEAALVVLSSTACDRELADLTDLTDVARHGPAGVVTVLGRADTVDSADRVAADLGGRLGRNLGPVTPVVGLLAETAVTGALRTDDLHALAALARLEPASLDLALLDPVDDDGPAAPGSDVPVAPAALARLMELLDRRGVALAVDVLRHRPDAGVGEVCAALLAASGLDRLVARLADEVRGRADLLAAAAALRRLDTLRGREPREAELLRDAVEELRTRPGFAEVALLEARARVRAGALPLPDDLAEELARLATTGPAAARLGLADHAPAELAGHAARRAAWWRSYASWGTPRERGRVAHAVHRAYLLLWRELTS